MNLKPFRDINEHEVITLFSTVEGDVSKGTFLQLVSFNPDNHNGFTTQIPSPSVPVGAFSANYEVFAKVQMAQNSSGVLGLSLVDVVSKNPNVWTVADQRRYFDKIPSGQAVPILKRGLVELAGYSGVAYPGAKGYVIATGQIAVAAPALSGSQLLNVGTFLSTSGADGYAVLQVNCI
jgi:hypothetical protein